MEAAEVLTKTCTTSTATNARKKKNSYLYLRTIFFLFDLKIKPSSKEATELPTRTYSTLTKENIGKRKFVP